MTAINNNKLYVFKSLQEKSRTKSFVHDFRSYRYRVSDEPTTATKVKIAAGSIIGTVAAMVICAKNQKKDLSKISNIINIKYGLKEMVGVSAGSILGGVITGIMFDKKNSTKEKTDEGVFQFLNASVPPLLVVGLFKLSDKYKKLNNMGFKVLATFAGLFAGMLASAKLANFINDPKDKVPDRKLTIKDSIANIDDGLGVLVLAKFPFVEKLHAEKILPAIYAWCGYRAGESN